MSWIRIIDEDEATGDLAETYEGLKKSRGKVSNILKVQSLNVEVMRAHTDLYMHLMFERSGLSREEKEMLATAVSVANGCDYCSNHHGEALNRYWKDQGRLETFKHDHTSMDMPVRTRKMLEYAVKLTKNPEEMKEEDILALHECGLPDEDILIINLITSYFNFVNRIATGLGVEFTEEEMRGYKV